LRVVAESAVDAPRLKHQSAFDERARRARRERRRAGLIATALRGDVPEARAKRARALRARRGDAADSSESDESDDSETDGVAFSGGDLIRTAVAEEATPVISAAPIASKSEEATQIG
jgi:hypothetical protein